MPFGFGRGWGKGGRGRGRRSRGGRRPGSFGTGGFGPGGPPTNCICPNCGVIVPHQPAIPCFRTRCPQCGSPMTRQFF